MRDDFNPYVERLIEAFNQIAADPNAQQLANRAVRSISLSGKIALDRGLQRLPKTAIEQFAQSVYSTLSSEAVTDTISAKVQALDEQKVKKIIDETATRMQDPKVALGVAKQVQEFLTRFPADELESQLETLLADRPMQERMMFLIIFNEAKPALEEMKTAPVQDVADRLSKIAKNMPSGLIANQVSNLIRTQVTPEVISGQAQEIISQLPAPKQVADVVHNVGIAASQYLKLISASTTPAETIKLVKSFAERAPAIIAETLAQKDNTPKPKKPSDKGGDFSF